MPDKPEAQAQAEEELLSRLVALNTQRAAEEAQGHIHWLRPDFQAPNASAAQQQTDTSTDVEDAEAAIPIAATKLIWPKVMQDQVKVVRELLAAAAMSADALTAQFKQKPKGVQEVVDTLVTLGMVREEQGVYAAA